MENSITGKFNWQLAMLITEEAADKGRKPI
jgi:hypothetical protein